EVVLIDEHPVDNDMMAMDVPLCFGQRMDGSVRNRALMLERVVETNPELASAHEAGVDVQLGTYIWGAFVNGRAVQELPVPMLGLADDRRSWLLGYDRLIVAAGARDVLLGFPGWERAGTLGAGGATALLTRYRALAARRLLVLGHRHGAERRAAAPRRCTPALRLGARRLRARRRRADVHERAHGLRGRRLCGLPRRCAGRSRARARSGAVGRTRSRRVTRRPR